MNKLILKQILVIRDSGVTNMFDWKTVERIAFDNNMLELANYIEEEPVSYFYFILSGKEPEAKPDPGVSGPDDMY